MKAGERAELWRVVSLCLQGSEVFYAEIHSWTTMEIKPVDPFDKVQVGLSPFCTDRGNAAMALHADFATKTDDRAVTLAVRFGTSRFQESRFDDSSSPWGSFRVCAIGSVGKNFFCAS